MRRISLHIQLMAVLAVLCLAGQSAATAPAWGASGGVSLSSSQKAELQKQVREQLAKDKVGGSSALGASGAASTGEGLGSSSGGSLAQKAEAEASEEEPATKTTATTSTESSGISMGVLVPVFILGALLLGGIAYLIVRDARSVAPVGDGLVGATTQEKALQRRKRRAKAKAARKQRKRNR